MQSYGKVFLTSLLFMSHSAYILVEARMINPGMASPTIGWAIPNQPLVKKMPYNQKYFIH